MTTAYDDFNIKEWSQSIHITDAGHKKLEVNSVTDLETLLLFREHDIELLKLNIGDNIRLRTGIKKLQAAAETIPPLEEPLPPSTKEDKSVKSQRLYTQEEVEQLLAGKEAVTTGAEGILPTSSQSKTENLTSLLGRPSSAISEVRDLMRDLLCLDDTTLNSRGEKAFLPVNFLSCIRGTQDKDEIIHSGRGLNLVLQSTTKRVTPDKLSFGQWISANARILDKLISSGRLTKTQLTDYLAYNRKIGDLLQQFTPASVFILDHVHRLEVHDTVGKRWNKIDATLQAAHLRKRDDVTNSYGKNINSSVPSDNPNRQRNQRQNQTPCWAYNSVEGCRYSKDKCRYSHSEANMDRDRAPRFQRNSNNSSTTN